METELAFDPVFSYLKIPINYQLENIVFHL